jgi:polyhydroxyalkanoate synthesis regulator phasin
MALYDDFSDGIKKLFLASVGAVAMSAEKSQGFVEELIKKGELTVEEGKTLNEELSRKVKEATDEASDSVLKATLRTMSAEERAAWIERAKKIASELEVEDAEYEVTEEDVAEAVEAYEAAEAMAEAEAEAEAEAVAEAIADELYSEE